MNCTMALTSMKVIFYFYSPNIFILNWPEESPQNSFLKSFQQLFICTYNHARSLPTCDHFKVQTSSKPSFRVNLITSDTTVELVGNTI